MNREPTPLHPLLARLAEARQKTDAVFGIASRVPDERPISERHRSCSTSAISKRSTGTSSTSAFERPSPTPDLTQLFAFGIDPVDGGLPRDQPGVAFAEDDSRVHAAGPRRIDARVDPRIRGRHFDDATPSGDTDRRGDRASADARRDARVHAHQLPLDQKTETRQHARAPRAGVRARDRAHSGRHARRSASRDSRHFGWDNEFDAHTGRRAGVRHRRYKVTNGDYLDSSTPAVTASARYGRRRLGMEREQGSRIRRSGSATKRTTLVICARCSTSSRCRSTGRSM